MTRLKPLIIELVHKTLSKVECIKNAHLLNTRQPNNHITTKYVFIVGHSL